MFCQTTAPLDHQYEIGISIPGLIRLFGHAGDLQESALAVSPVSDTSG